MKPICIHVLGEKKTEASALKYIVSGLEDFYPNLVNVRISNKKYNYSKLSLENGGLEKPSNSDDTFISINNLDKKFRNSIGDDYLLILAHWSFCVERRDKFDWYHVNKGRFSGTSASKSDGPKLNNFIVIGGDKVSSRNNLIIAAHEVFHVFSERRGTVYGELDHCDGIVRVDDTTKRCLMNVGSLTRRGVGEIALKLCNKCKKKFEGFCD